MSKNPYECVEVPDKDIKKLYFLILDRLINDGLNDSLGSGENYFEDRVFSKKLFKQYSTFLKDYQDRRILESQYKLNYYYDEASNCFGIKWKKRKLELPIKFTSSSQI